MKIIPKKDYTGYDFKDNFNVYSNCEKALHAITMQQLMELLKFLT